VVERAPFVAFVVRLDQSDRTESSKAKGAISVIFGYQVSQRLRYCKRVWSILHNTAVTEQWTTKWPYIANAVIRMVKNHGE